MDNVLLEKHAGYAIVTLNRPAEMNALSRNLRREFVEVFADCCADRSIRVLILTGKGKAFCAGFDLKTWAPITRAMRPRKSTTRWRMRSAAFEGPIIGAINGHAITGGFEMALACDVLIASENARFADTHARVGILPGSGLEPETAAPDRHLAGQGGFVRRRPGSLRARPMSGGW